MELKGSREISTHLVKVWGAIRDANQWLDNNQIAAKAGVYSRTTRQHTRMLVAEGLVEMLKMSPGYKFRLHPKLAADHPLVQEIERVAEALGTAIS